MSFTFLVLSDEPQLAAARAARTAALFAPPAYCALCAPASSVLPVLAALAALSALAALPVLPAPSALAALPLFLRAAPREYALAMELIQINWLAVLLAFVANFFVGFVYFSPKVAFPAWWKAMGKEGKPGEGDNMGVVFGLTAVAGAVVSVAMAVLFSLIAAGAGDIPVLNGVGLGVLIGLGMVAATALTHRLFAGHGLKVWALEAGGDVLSYATIGLVLSFFY